MTEPTARLAGRPVHRIGFGAMQLPGPGVFGPPRDRDAALDGAAPGRRRSVSITSTPPSTTGLTSPTS